MGLQIYITRKKELDDDVNAFYTASWQVTDQFKQQSAALERLVDFIPADEIGCEVSPEDYSHLIPLFEEEKRILEETGMDQRATLPSKITLYDAVEECYNGLLEAQRLGSNIRLT